MRGTLRLAARLGALAAACVTVVLTAPGADAARPPQPPRIYVATGPNFSVAFKVEAPRVYVLAVTADLYCAYREPPEALEPTAYEAFPMPKLMLERQGKLVAKEAHGNEFGNERVVVQARVQGGAVSGELGVYSNREESLHCQSGSPEGAPTALSFQALPYVRATSPRASAPVAGETALYFGHHGPAETFFRRGSEGISIRGSLVSHCPLAGRPGRNRRSILYGSPVAAVGGTGRFHVRQEFERKPLDIPVTETASIAGIVGPNAITGTYRDTAVARHPVPPPSRCATPLLHIRAARYLPAR